MDEKLLDIIASAEEYGLDPVSELQDYFLEKNSRFSRAQVTAIYWRLMGLKCQTTK